MQEKFKKYIDARYNHLQKLAKSALTTKKELAGDLLHDVLDYMDDKINYNLPWPEFTTNTETFLAYVIKTQARSVTSPFHKKYRQKGSMHYQNNYEVTDILVMQDDDDTNEVENDYILKKLLYDDILHMLENDFPSNSGEVLLFKLYYIEGHSYRKIEDLTGISYSTVWKSVQKIRNHLKKQIIKKNIEYYGNNTKRIQM